MKKAFVLIAVYILTMTAVTLIYVVRTIKAKSESNCYRILGTGSLKIVIVPAGFDDNSPEDVSHYKLLSLMIADGFRNTEPYKSHTDKFSIYRLDDYRGKDLKPTDEDLWYNMDLINAASSCKYDEILVVANNSGITGGYHEGFYSVVISGTPLSCDPTTCTSMTCPRWSPTCSNDYGTATVALHEMGHTLVGLSHIEDPQFCETETDTIMCPVLRVPLPSGFTVDEQDIILHFLLSH